MFKRLRNAVNAWLMRHSAAYTKWEQGGRLRLEQKRQEAIMEAIAASCDDVYVKPALEGPGTIYITSARLTDLMIAIGPERADTVRAAGRDSTIRVPTRTGFPRVHPGLQS